jgi:LysM repeat protein
MVTNDRTASPPDVARRGVGRSASRGWRAGAAVAVLGALALAGFGDVSHVVGPGESLWTIAQRYEVSPQAIASANHLANPNIVPLGSTLVIPGVAPSPTPAPAPVVVLHTVVAGENLTTIATHYGVTVPALVTLNSLANPDIVPIGSVLHIPAAATAATASAPPAPTPAAAPAPAPTPAPAPSPTFVVHTVVPGENLTGIAVQNKTSVRALLSLNTIPDPNVVTIGTVLRVAEVTPTAVVAPASPTGPAPVTLPPPPVAPTLSFSVAPGDTMSTLAARYGVTVQTLASLNGITDPDLVRMGQVLKAPNPALGPVGQLLVHFSQVYSVSPALVEGLAWQESGWQQQVVSPVGAIGVMQVMPGTATFTSMYLVLAPLDLTSLSNNIQAGVAFLAFLIRQAGGNEALAVAGYYQGLGSVEVRGMYTDTRQYVANVEALKAHFAS